MFRTLIACLLVAPLAAPAAPARRARPVHRRFDAHEAAQLLPLLGEAVRFPTVAGNDEARLGQQQWLLRTAAALGLVAREAGPVTEVELPGPPGAPVLGLVVHGDVQPVEASRWSFPPFLGELRGEVLVGRGAADDKGPLVQALLSLSALKAAGPARTHTVRLLVGSDEESGNEDIKSYLSGHAPPDLSLVLDAEFPVTVGEKAWQALSVTAQPEAAPRPGAERFDWEPVRLTAGLAPSIVPDVAVLELRLRPGKGDFGALLARLAERRPDPDTRLEQEQLPADAAPDAGAPAAPGARLRLIVRGRSAHSGMNVSGGRNALVSLAHLVEGLLPPSPEDDLLAFAGMVGADLHGAALGLTEKDSAPGWGGYSVSPTLVQQQSRFAAAGQEAGTTLVVNLRRPPPLSGEELRTRLEARVAAFNRDRSARLVAGGWYGDEPLVFDPRAKLVQRLLAAWNRATGHHDGPTIAGGGTYAKRLPRSIAFGMWIPSKPYTGHDVDEQISRADLLLGAHALIEALVDLACQKPLTEPFLP